MPRYRKLYVKVTESLDVQAMPDDFTRLTWVLLPLCLDSAGRGLDNAAWLKSRLYPLRLDVTPKMLARALDWFAERGMIVRYQVAGRAYLHAPTFHKYQGDTSKEAASEYPAPPEPAASGSGAPPERVARESASEADPESAAVSDPERDPAGEAEAGEARPASAASGDAGAADREKVLELARRVLPTEALNAETPNVVRELVNDFGLDRVCDALMEMDVQNPRRRCWRYVYRILERWQPRDGAAAAGAPG